MKHDVGEKVSRDKSIFPLKSLI